MSSGNDKISFRDTCSGIGKVVFCFLVLPAFLVFGGVSCTSSHFSEKPMPQTVYVGYESAQPVPPGVVRYCWEEPIVEFQDNGPGLDSEKQWYVPASTAVRMVKQGRWRPCRAVPSEVKGETKNER